MVASAVAAAMFPHFGASYRFPLTLALGIPTATLAAVFIWRRYPHFRHLIWSLIIMVLFLVDFVTWVFLLPLLVHGLH